MSLKVGCSLLLLWAGSVALTPSYATDFTHLFQTRTDTMNAIDKALKTLADMVKGQTDFDAGTARQAAEAIARHARTLPGLFPPGSNARPSESRPEIWADWDRFAGLSGALAADADRLALAAASARAAGDIRQGLLVLGGNCKSCHESFRAAGGSG